VNETTPLRSANHAVRPELAEVLRSLKPGQRIRITQTVRLNSRPGKSWPTTVEGTFRGLNYLATGLSTDRVPQDDVTVLTLHFTKEPHGELSSVSIDEHTKVEVLP
jgi:hypothetical protein